MLVRLFLSIWLFCPFGLWTQALINQSYGPYTVGFEVDTVYDFSRVYLQPGAKALELDPDYSAVKQIMNRLNE